MKARAKIIESNLYETTFNETIELLTDVRNYIETGRIIEKNYPSENRLKITTKLTHLTQQLAAVMAWLIMNKAYHSNEISKEELEKESISLAREIGVNDTKSKNKEIYPDILNDIIYKSTELFKKTRKLQSDLIKI